MGDRSRRAKIGVMFPWARFVLAPALVAFVMLPTYILPLHAATLDVGPDKLYTTPSAAAAKANDGDHIEIAPGSYFDCAVWRANDLVIEGTGPGVGITDKTCMGKALFVIVVFGSIVVLTGIPLRPYC